MDRCKLERIVTHFQARARGYLMRNEVQRAREDFEDIVKEIDGGLDCLKWIKKALYLPQFIDTQDAAYPFNRDASHLNNSNPEPSDDNEAPAERSLNKDEDGGGLLEKLEAERDASEICAFTSEPQEILQNSSLEINTDTKNERDVPLQEKAMDSVCDSTIVWSSVDTHLDSCHSFKGLRQYCLARDVQRTPEALRVHRNTLSMELLWLQQAIDSRKKYLSLKSKLNAS